MAFAFVAVTSLYLLKVTLALREKIVKFSPPSKAKETEEKAGVLAVAIEDALHTRCGGTEKVR